MELTLGATYKGDERCRFQVWAPLKERIDLHLLTPADRLVPLTKQADGYYEATVDGVPPGSLYRYRLPGGVERPDPASRRQPDGVHGPSAVVADAFAWADHAWPGLPLRDYVIYELHVGTFTPKGTFEAVIPRLDALKELGITAIELMPIAQFPGTRNWGYDGVYPFAAQESYGGPLGLKRLVDACHARGLAVVLDVVYNHLGPEGNYLADFAPYFTDRYKTDWGWALNFDGPFSDEVRRYFLENALYWLRDCHIDALRLDAVNMIQDLSPRHFLEELGEVIEQNFPKPQGESSSPGGPPPRYLIAEYLLNDPKVIRPRDLFGYGMDAQWCNDFHHALHALLTGERQGYYADFGQVEHLARAIRNGYHFTGQYSHYRGRRAGREPTHTRAEQFVVYAQNHDQVGNRQLGDRLSNLVPFAALKLAAAATLLSPNLPLLFMGEEYGETAPFPFFISHGDPHLVEAVRQGRRAEFAEFDWQGDIPDPQAEATFRTASLQWHLRDEGRHRVLLDWYRELLRLRRTHPALAQLSKVHLEATALEDERVLIVRRWHGDAQAALVLHFGDEPRPMPPLPPGQWRTVLDSEAERWSGTAVAAGHLAPWQALLFVTGS